MFYASNLAEIIVTVVSAIFMGGCVEEYLLPETNAGLSLLVVDGAVVIEEGAATLKLSRTNELQHANQKPVPETKAEVTLKNDAGGAYQLVERRNGEYLASGLSIAYGTAVKIHIRTANGREYMSDLVVAKKTPAIDSVTWHVAAGNVQVEVNTHDPDNATWYYRWEYEEKYEYKSYFQSLFKKGDDGRPHLREPYEQISLCWMSTPSTSILLGSSIHLSKDVITRVPVVRHEGNGDRFSRRYSILVKQYAITREEYDFWQMLRKNTESVGTLFDSQPAHVVGNITCLSNPEEQVLGFFSVRNKQEKRLFLEADQLKSHNFTDKRQECYLYTKNIKDLPELQNMEIIDMLPGGESMLMSTKPCIDCRLKGGSNQKPAFW
ncbi:MAG: DUF4249 domain-containing protein [Rufibacter sp.]